MAELGPAGVVPIVQVHPTRRCNLACAHCYTSSGPGAREELELELLSACLADAAGLGYRQLAVSGGEPLLYPALAPLLARAKELGMLVTMTSNGMLATASRWNALAPLVDLVAVSIDGTPSEHDALRRRQGAFARTLANLEVIRASGVPFGLLFTLTQHNVDSLEFVVQLAALQGARSVQVHPLTLHGRAMAALPQSRPDGVEISAALAEAMRLGEALGVAIHVDALTVDQLVQHHAAMVPKAPVSELVRVAPILIVQSDASVVPLTHELHAQWALGSLRKSPLPTLARAWLAAGKGDALAAVCERTWAELSSDPGGLAYYWYDEVAVRSQPKPRRASLAAAGPSGAP